VPKSAYCLEKADSVTPTGVPSSNCQEIYSRIDKPRFMLCLKREFISEPNKYDEFEDILSSFISLQLKDCKFITGGIIDAAIYISVHCFRVWVFVLDTELCDKEL
jgi:hypothetical protein